MKKILALMLAMLMAASMSVAAMAEETGGDTAVPDDATEGPATSEDTVDRDTPVTLGDCYPGETITRYWNISMTDGTISLPVDTDLEVVNWSHDNTEKFEAFLSKRAAAWSYSFTPTNLPFGVEEVGKVFDDTIHITVKNGDAEETYSFKLSVIYDGSAMIECQNQPRVFTVGKQVVLDVKILDPAGTFTAPYEASLQQGPPTGVEGTQDDLLRVDDIKKNEKDLTITVTPIKAGHATIKVRVVDSADVHYGHTWQAQVIEEGQKPDDVEYMPSKSDSSSSDNQRAEESAMDALESVNEAIASGEAMPAKAQTVTTATGESATVVSAKLYGLGASLSVDTMATLADSKVGLRANLDNGAAEIVIPGGFTMPTGTGVLAYSLGFQKEPLYTNLMTADVAAKNPDAKTEVYKVGGGTLPTTATLTIKTKITGRVNIYYWNEETRRYTLIASPTAENGKVTFATKQLGNLVVTTGAI